MPQSHLYGRCIIHTIPEHIDTSTVNHTTDDNAFRDQANIDIGYLITNEDRSIMRKLLLKIVYYLRDMAN